MIRQLHSSDAILINRLNREELGYDMPVSFTEKQLIKLLKDSQHHFLLGFEDDETKELVGYLHAEVYESTYAATMFNVLAIAVFVEHTKKGIGKLLLRSLEKEAKKREYAGIRLNSGEHRLEAHKFYQAVDYELIKMQKNFRKTV